MKKLLILSFILPLFICGQTAKSPSKATLTKIYTQAISDFIKAANQKNKTNFDTLYFLKRSNGQPDDFPKIELPKVIEKAQIKLIAPKLAEKNQNQNKKRTHINLLGWVTDTTAEFIFVVFSNGFAHQYDYNLNYKYNTKLKVFELEKIEFKPITKGK